LTPIALAIVSLIAAVALWVAVTETENPTTDEELPFTIPVAPVGVADNLAVYSLSPESIDVTVRATEETLNELTASNFRATVDMTGIRDSQSTQNIVVEVLGLEDGEISVVEQSSRFTRVVLEPEVTKTVPVEVNSLGSLPQGFIVAATESNPPQVTVIGPASSVGLVVRADADVNLTGVRSNLHQQYELTPRDAGGAIQPRVRVEPRSAEIRLAVEQLETPQVVPVLEDWQGEVAHGYRVAGVDSDPRNVLVTGSLEILQTLDYLATEPIDVSGASETITRSVALQIPTGVVAELQNVSVTIEIVPDEGQRAITVAPSVANVPSGLNAVLQTSSLTVRVSGETRVVDELTPADIRAIVDAAGLAEGVHTLNVQVILPTGMTLDSVEPPQAVIALRP
jgi:YbbR domain-containing protein